MKNLVRFLVLALFSALALAASVPYTFSAGSPAAAAEVNADFAALVSAVTTLEAKVAALEGAAAALTVADVAGTYRYLTLANKSGADSAAFAINTSSSVEDASFTFDAGGTFSFSGTRKSGGANARITDCNPPSLFTTSMTLSHDHKYNYAACTNGSTSMSPSIDQPATGSGNWSLSGTDGIVLTQSAGPSGTPRVLFKVYISKAARMGFAVVV